MSYDLMIWDGDQPRTDEAATRVFRELVDLFVVGAAGELPTERIRACIEALQSRWPAGSAEEHPFSTGVPEQDDGCGPVLYLTVQFGFDDAVEEIAAIATALGLVVYDPQGECVVKPANERRPRRPATDGSMKEVRRAVEQVLAPAGYERRSNVFRRVTTGGLVAVIELQTRNRAGERTVDAAFGLWSPDLAQVRKYGPAAAEEVTRSEHCSIHGGLRGPMFGYDLVDAGTPTRIAEAVRQQALPALYMEDFDDLLEWWRAARRVMYDPETDVAMPPEHPVMSGWGPITNLNDDLVAALQARSRSEEAREYAEEGEGLERGDSDPDLTADALAFLKQKRSAAIQEAGS